MTLSAMPKGSLSKSAQEVEIDHILAEEFTCDPGFAERFLAHCNFSFLRLKVIAAIIEPSLGGEGYGDLMIEGEENGRKIALLIEDKITAAPATRQAERYKRYAKRLRKEGWDEVCTILVAPMGYQGEGKSFDRVVELQDVIGMILSPDATRCAYRRGLIQRAIDKREARGVQIPDLILHTLKRDYLAYALAWCEAQNLPLSFPPLRQSYYDGDAWIEKIRHPDLPLDVWLRHRLWTSIKGTPALVDLVFERLPEDDFRKKVKSIPSRFEISPFSKKRGTQLSLQLPPMSQSTGFQQATVLQALQAMRDLVHWYKGALS